MPNGSVATAANGVDIVLPYERMPHQVRASQSDRKIKMKVWHRQSGKDLDFVCGDLLPKALTTIGNYWYCHQDSKSLRRNFWEKKDDQGRPTIGYYIPREILYKDPHETNHVLTLINPYEPGKPGSSIEGVAVDSIDRDTVRGATLKGCGYSEMAYYQNNMVWDNLQASIRKPENDGWQVIMTTPNGHNHLYDLYETNKNNPAWFVELLTIDDTGLFGWDFIQSLLREGADWQFLLQEYYCSFNAFVRGVVFAEEYEYLVTNNRITAVPWDPTKLVHTCWDVGRDGTVVWFFQSHGLGWKFLECMADSRINFEYYAEELRRKPYVYGTHLGPFDLNDQQFFAGVSKLQSARDLGVDFYIKMGLDGRPVKYPKPESQAAAKRLIRMSWFDQEKCADGLRAMREYHHKWDDVNKVLSKEPVHDWTSHYMDGLMVGGLGIEDVDDDYPGIYDMFDVADDHVYDCDFPLFRG